MSVYVIILKEPKTEVWEQVRETWPNHHYILSDTAAFVAPAGISLIGQVCDRLGINDVQKNANGVVLEITAYQGYSDTALGEWLTKAREV